VVIIITIYVCLLTCRSITFVRCNPLGNEARPFNPLPRKHPDKPMSSYTA